MAGSSRQPMPSIFKLTVDCCDEIFEYLSLKDLHTFGQTCKTFQKVAGEYFQRNYSAAAKFLDPDGVYTVYSDNNGVTNERIKTLAFNRFTNYISHYYHNLAPLNYIHDHSNEFESLKHIYLVCLDLNKKRVACMKNILAKIEIVQIRNSSCYGDIYEVFLKFCINLKRLLVQDADFDRSYHPFDSDTHFINYWLRQEYPKLEYLELIPKFEPKLMGLGGFFEKNPGVRGFSTSSLCLWDNRQELLASNAKLDTLEVKIFPITNVILFTDPPDSDSDDDNAAAAQPGTAEKKRNLPSLFDLLKKLYAQGFYKRLQFYIDNVDEKTSIQLAALPALEKLCIQNFSKAYSLSHLCNLKELAIFDGANPIDMEIFANNFQNLQRLYMTNATIDAILPFIRRSTNLTRIKVVPKDDAHFNDGILKLPMLNKEREHLFGARKVAIHVPDNIFLKTKWTTLNGDTELKFVEMKRADSFEWDQHY